LDPLTVAFFLALSGVAAGFLGALLGLGGGFLLVPIMTLGLGVDIKVAVAVSLVAVVATSTGSGAASVRRGVANTRLAMFLEVATTLGAIAGAYIAISMGREFLFALFGIALLTAIPFMIRPLAPPKNGGTGIVPSLIHTSRLRLDGHYANEADDLVAYEVHRPGAGFALSWFAGVVSGLLGIGGGIVKVPTMRGVMGVPMKISIGTSNFMIGVTACAGALVYLARGTLDPVLAGTAALGVVVGSRYASQVVEGIDTRRLVLVFAVVMAAMALSMFLKAGGVFP
jgi:uncharacterized membrane protein YfcA